jgi:hypothetical protein
MDPYRGTGRTTQTLIEAYEYRESASEELPALVYAASIQDAERLARMFCDLAQARGSAVTRIAKFRVVLDGEHYFEFRSYSQEEDSPPGSRYSLIFVDHYAWETVQGGPDGLRPGEPLKYEEEPPAPLVRLWEALKEKLG